MRTGHRAALPLPEPEPEPAPDEPADPEQLELPLTDGEATE